MVLMDLTFFYIYRFIAFPTALTLAHICSGLLPEKARLAIAERRNLNFQALPSRPIWVHASSGEIEYSRSVIRMIKSQYPQSLILVTYSSPSARKILEKVQGVDLFMPIPWDSAPACRKFLDFYKPHCALFARTDVWPEMSNQLKIRNIPSLLFAATLANNSSRKMGISRFLNRFSLNNLSQIFAVSESDSENFREMKIKTPVEIGGDTRYDQVLYRINNPVNYKAQLRPAPAEKIFVAGSTWPEDEEILLPAIPKLIEKGVRIVIAPHELTAEHIQDLSDKLISMGIRHDFYTKIDTWNSSLLIIDTIGNLQEIYSWAHFAFVGGSFKAKVHSVMEPLCFNIPIFVGPFHINNREALKFQNLLLTSGVFAVNVMQNAREFLSTVDLVLKLQKPNLILKEKIMLEQNSTLKVLKWVEETVVL